MRKIAVLVGSLRRDSINAAYAHGLEKLAAGQFTFDFVDMDLPLYNNDLWDDPPAKVLALKAAIRAADGVLIVTPEYNRSIPAVTKNAVDWASRPYGESAWAGKAVAITGASPGSQGTAVAQSQLRSTMTILGTHVLSDPEVYISFKPEVFASDGTVLNEGTAKFLRGFLDAFAALIDKIR
jgi:chromate reductase, NAD(P)H dehydrogenase (quinone)